MKARKGYAAHAGKLCWGKWDDWHKQKRTCRFRDRMPNWMEREAKQQEDQTEDEKEAGAAS